MREVQRLGSLEQIDSSSHVALMVQRAFALLETLQQLLQLCSALCLCDQVVQNAAHAGMNQHQ